ncbi:preprotein translocase subunit SecE [Dysgonomonas sp. 216]|uniref:preprotein translocase subunit SecE n=1 Tax=Dysgonomonas sp. 216 TaxID=2302934 RepID=UPI0013D1A8D5|nr:preprotein translocase subunit SecE [Dysgonomonas sp. 216]NDW17389.1 preprotein translocase subunit SecE [Dysgonomonas sp. 216]
MMKKIINSIKDSYNELVYKVSWPTRAEVSSSAVVVMIASLIMALVVFGVDSVFQGVMDFIYGVSKIKDGNA